MLLWPCSRQALGRRPRKKFCIASGTAATTGKFPRLVLLFDAAGNLYGTTALGGNYNGGTAFELMPQTGGGWTEKVLHSFGNGNDGSQPFAGLIFDGSGNLYGTTVKGGAYGGGTVFELTPETGGGWRETVLHYFDPNDKDGSSPYEILVLDTAGNLYGTTYWGGDYSQGTVFELMRDASWKEKVLRPGDRSDGSYPHANLIMDGAGNLYGTAYGGGTFGYGTVFELSPTTGGDWTEQVLHSFDPNGKDGVLPLAGLIFDAGGNLYGTTYRGGAFDDGTVFKLSPAGGGGWTEQVLHSFDPNGKDGVVPQAGLILDAAGNLYGTTYLGGAFDDGTVFKLSPATGGGWTEQVLHSFGANGKDGVLSLSSLIFDTAGNLYGTTLDGGEYGRGTVFEITP